MSKRFFTAKLPFLLIVIFAFGVVFMSYATAFAATYYVDATGGNDINAGTSTSTAWQTLTKVKAQTYSPGDIILFKRGETFAGNLVVGQSGSAGNPITFGAYGTGARPIINAAGNLHGLDIRTSKSYLNFESLDIRNATVNQILVLGSASHLNFTDISLFGGQKGFTLFTPGIFSDITISSSTASGYATGAAAAIRLEGALTVNDMIIDGFVATAGASGQFGILTDTTSTTSSGLIIRNSSFNGHGSYGMGWRGLVAGATIENVIVNNNVNDGIRFNQAVSGLDIIGVTANNNGRQGISFRTAAGYVMEDIVIRESELNNNTLNGLALGGFGQGRDMLVTETTASNNSNDGFNIHDDWINVILDTVTANDNGIDGSGSDGDGISFHEASTGVIRNSIASNNKKAAVTNVGTASTTIYNNIFTHNTLGTNALAEFYDGGRNVLHNNTFYNPSQQGKAIFGNATTTVIAMNNIISGFNIGIERSGSATFITDYNLVHNAGSSAWSGLPQDENSLTTNPQFANAGGGDFSLLSSSPAINAGSDSVCSATDYSGQVRNEGVCDMGAFEYELIAPDASFSVNLSNLQANFTDESTDSDGTIASWNWSFGDGNNSTLQNPNHVYENSGTYDIELTVTDNHDVTDSYSASVTVVAAASGGGSLRRGCTDKKALNYSTSVRHDESKCRYAEAEDQTSINELLKRIEELKSQLAQLLGNKSDTKCLFTRDLQLNDEGEDVLCLQKYLNGRGFLVAQTGPGSTGNETTRFGQLTYNALVNFQNTHAKEILAPSGISSGTGYFGPSTRDFINKSNN